MYPKGNLLIPAPHGHLEAVYRPPVDRAKRVALVLHPHPLFGGTMHNKVVYRAARALEEIGFVTLRFNFRGVGYSTGEHDEGRGELDDARIALDHLLKDQPQAREVLIAGFSFGAAVGLRLGCEDRRVDRLLAIGTPVRLDDLSFLDSCTKSKLFIHGAQDEIAPLAPLVERLKKLPATSPWRILRIPGAGHFFDDRLNELTDAVKGLLNDT
jgi:alpha/beta superfamily hydrolase